MSLENTARMALPGTLLSDGSVVYKFGYQGLIATTPIAVWDMVSAYNYIPSAQTLNISSSSIDDDAGGTGALTVQLYGLDGNFTEITETITLDGQTEVVTSLLYLRLFRMIIRTAGSGGENAGTIYASTGGVTIGVPDNSDEIYMAVSPGENQTLAAVYTIPAGKTGRLLQVIASSFGNASRFATIRFRVRPEGEVFQTKDKFSVTAGEVSFPRLLLPPFEEKSDIEITAAANTGTIDVSASFELLLDRN